MTFNQNCRCESVMKNRAPGIGKKSQKYKNNLKGRGQRLPKDMDEKQIQKILKDGPNYLGSYAINELETLSIRSYPASMIVNMDNRWEPGSHWIPINITNRYIYIL